MKQIKIMRGISGSGKSTHARKLAYEANQRCELPIICSADDFFIGPDGYKFNAEKLGEAHQWCMRKFLQALQDKMDPVIVDNTNINVEDISPYIIVGEALGYDVEIIQMNCDADIAASRNVHGVPRLKIRQIDSRLQTVKLPGRWKISYINP